MEEFMEEESSYSAWKNLIISEQEGTVRTNHPGVFSRLEAFFQDDFLGGNIAENPNGKGGVLSRLDKDAIDKIRTLKGATMARFQEEAKEIARQMKAAISDFMQQRGKKDDLYINPYNLNNLAALATGELQNVAPSPQAKTSARVCYLVENKDDPKDYYTVFIQIPEDDGDLPAIHHIIKQRFRDTIHLKPLSFCIQKKQMPTGEFVLTKTKSTVEVAVPSTEIDPAVNLLKDLKVVTDSGPERGVCILIHKKALPRMMENINETTPVCAPDAILTFFSAFFERKGKTVAKPEEMKYVMQEGGRLTTHTWSPESLVAHLAPQPSQPEEKKIAIENIRRGMTLPAPLPSVGNFTSTTPFHSTGGSVLQK